MSDKSILCDMGVLDVLRDVSQSVEQMSGFCDCHRNLTVPRGQKNKSFLQKKLFDANLPVLLSRPTLIFGHE